MDNLTKDEKIAIKQLEDLSKIWPKSLWLWSASGQLCVMKYSLSEMGDGMNTHGSVDHKGQVRQIKNIPNDGGDW